MPLWRYDLLPVSQTSKRRREKWKTARRPTKAQKGSNWVFFFYLKKHWLKQVVVLVVLTQFRQNTRGSTVDLAVPETGHSFECYRTHLSSGVWHVQTSESEAVTGSGPWAQWCCIDKKTLASQTLVQQKPCNHRDVLHHSSFIQLLHFQILFFKIWTDQQTQQSVSNTKNANK